MGIVERLRETAHAFARWEPVIADEVKEAADLFERLRGYVVHTDECAISGWLPFGDEPYPACTCGLTALIKEIEGD